MAHRTRALVPSARLPGGEVDSRQLWLLLVAVAIGVVIRVVYLALFSHPPLRGDETEYDLEGQLIASGHVFWTRAPYGILHASAWKAPGYPLWVGFWYAIAGHHPIVVRAAQVPLGVVTIVLTWHLARRLFGLRVATLAAFVVALYPLAWQYEELLYSESLATPLTLGLLILAFCGVPSRRRAVWFGLLLGLTLLVRPSSGYLILGPLVAWGLTSGWRRGLGLTVLAAVAAAVVVAPWTIRNAVVLHGFLPISLQSAAAYGTFNAESAHDPVFPYAWRAAPAVDADLFDPRHPLSDIELNSRLTSRATSYISAHPGSLLAAFYWNGLSRLWDVRHRSRSVAEVQLEGRSRLVTDLGLDAYYVLLPLSLVGLWRLRRRRALVFALIAIAAGASVVFTIDSGTRYRAPFEPMIATLACVGVLGSTGGPAKPTEMARTEPYPA